MSGVEVKPKQKTNVRFMWRKGGKRAWIQKGEVEKGGKKSSLGNNFQKRRVWGGSVGWATEKKTSACPRELGPLELNVGGQQRRRRGNNTRRREKLIDVIGQTLTEKRG